MNDRRTARPRRARDHHTGPSLPRDRPLGGVPTGACRPPAFDLSAVCSGFVYGLTVASSMITAGGCDRALVIGADVYSSIVTQQPDDGRRLR